MPEISALERYRQEVHNFKVILELGGGGTHP